MEYLNTLASIQMTQTLTYPLPNFIKPEHSYATFLSEFFYFILFKRNQTLRYHWSPCVNLPDQFPFRPAASFFSWRKAISLIQCVTSRCLFYTFVLHIYLLDYLYTVILQGFEKFRDLWIFFHFIVLEPVECFTPCSWGDAHRGELWCVRKRVLESLCCRIWTSGDNGGGS